MRTLPLVLASVIATVFSSRACGQWGAPAANDTVLAVVELVDTLRIDIAAPRQAPPAHVDTLAPRGLHVITRREDE